MSAQWNYILEGIYASWILTTNCFELSNMYNSSKELQLKIHIVGLFLCCGLVDCNDPCSLVHNLFASSWLCDISWFCSTYKAVSSKVWHFPFLQVLISSWKYKLQRFLGLPTGEFQCIAASVIHCLRPDYLVYCCVKDDNGLQWL